MTDRPAGTGFVTEARILPGRNRNALTGWIHLDGYATAPGPLSGDITTLLNAAIADATVLDRIYIGKCDATVSSMITIPASKTGLSITSDAGAKISRTVGTIFLNLAADVTIAGLQLNVKGSGTEASLPDSYGAAVVYKQVTGGLIDCTIVGAGATGTAGAGVWLTSSVGVTVRGEVSGCYIGVNTDSYYAGRCGENRISARIHDCVHGYIYDGQGADFANNRADILSEMSIYNVTSSGVHIDNATAGATVTNVDVYNSPTADGFVVLHATSGAKLSNVSARGCNNGLVITNAESTSTPSQTTVTNGVFRGNTLAGVAIYAARGVTLIGGSLSANKYGLRGMNGYTASQVKLQGVNIRGNQCEGVAAPDPYDWQILGGTMDGNSTLTAQTYAAIRVSKVNIDPDGFVVTGVTFHLNGATSQSQKAAVLIEAATATNVQIMGNRYGSLPYAGTPVVDASGVARQIGNLPAGTTDEIRNKLSSGRVDYSGSSALIEIANSGAGAGLSLVTAGANPVLNVSSVSFVANALAIQHRVVNPGVAGGKFAWKVWQETGQFDFHGTTRLVASQPVDSAGAASVSANAGIYARTVSSSTGFEIYRHIGSGSMSCGRIWQDDAGIKLGTAARTTTTDGSQTWFPDLTISRTDATGVSIQVGASTGGTVALGFGKAPVARPSGTPADATDLASAIALVNKLKAALMNTTGGLGLIS